MDYVALASVINKRKAVRAFERAPLDQKALDEIRAFAREVPTLFPSYAVDVEIVGRDRVRGLGVLSVPHFLVLRASVGAEGELAAGYLGQHLSLMMSARGIGSCWLGMTIPPSRGADRQDLAYAGTIAFGTPAEPLFRGIGEFKRKPLAEIASPLASAALADAATLLEAARLSPSAMNRQPWFFAVDDRLVHAFSCPAPGLLNIARRWRYVDLGIACCHLAVAARAAGRAVAFTRSDRTPAGGRGDYALTMTLP
ncbi:MAG TPA: nitroreductase family protein [Treponemataceae bacterium]|nr:nitroreductase family protein [Treponemataceae bacterium]